MPVYEFKCVICNTIYEEARPISKCEDPSTCSSCGSKDTHKYFGTPPNIGDPVHMGVKKPDKQFTDMLKRMNDRVPGSKINVRD